MVLRSVCLSIVFLTFLCSCGQKEPVETDASSVEVEELIEMAPAKGSLLDILLGVRYDLPDDFHEALEYIRQSNSAFDYQYLQLIIEHPESYYYDFSGYDNAMRVSYSPDSVLKLYRVFMGMHEISTVLQFPNDSGRIVTVQLSAEPLSMAEEGEKVTDSSYKYGYASQWAKILGQVEMGGVKIYIVDISDYVGYYVDLYGTEEGTVYEYVVGLRLTDSGYRYVPIFEHPSSSYVCSTGEPDDYMSRVRNMSSFAVDLMHERAWYQEDEQLLLVPTSVENPKETFLVYRWNRSRERFERVLGDSYGQTPGLHPSLGYASGRELETILCFDDLLVRVDRIGSYEGDGERFQYASWKKGKTMADKPDVLIKTGVSDEKTHTFRFYDGEYEYMVPWTYHAGKFMIKKGSDIIRERMLEVDELEEEEYVEEDVEV